MQTIFLHGGGDQEASRQDTFGRFVKAMPSGTSGLLSLVIVEEDETAVRESHQAYSAIFTQIGFPSQKIVPIYAANTGALTYETLTHLAPSAVFVCGGVTPDYHQALCADLSWLAYLKEATVPYGGTSAGAAIAAHDAILGGWQSTRQGQSREILFVGASEGLDPLTVKPGLELVPFAVEVHASQMGTLNRLIHAVELGLMAEGWATNKSDCAASASRCQ